MYSLTQQVSERIGFSSACRLEARLGKPLF